MINRHSVEWRKSSYSAQGANCVEAARATGRCSVRDSKDPTGPILAFTAREWSALLNAIKAGVHDLP